MKEMDELKQEISELYQRIEKLEMAIDKLKKQDVFLYRQMDAVGLLKTAETQDKKKTREKWIVEEAKKAMQRRIAADQKIKRIMLYEIEGDLVSAGMMKKADIPGKHEIFAIIRNNFPVKLYDGLQCISLNDTVKAMIYN